MLDVSLQAITQTMKAIDPQWAEVLVGGGLGSAILGFLFKISRVMARMEAHMAAHRDQDDQRFADVGKRFEGMDRRADGMRGAVHEIGEKIASLTDAIVGRVQEIISRLETRLEDANGRIDRHLEDHR